MDSNPISNLASQIRSSATNKPNVLTISTRTLSHLLNSLETLEEQPSSFHVKSTHNFELLRDIQYLANYVQQTKNLKLYGDGYEEGDLLDVTKFKSLTSLEFCRVDVNSVKGLQVVRPQLHKLACQRVFNSMNDVLSNCGGDKSHNYCWNELKEVSFINSSILELDNSLECAPWLHTLDLSHNEIRDMEAVSCLPNLKYLNLSYNKLEAIGVLKGQICSRLQNLILKNNFIEDISGLRSLVNLWVLDLSNNCVIDHKSLLTVAHLATLQWLNLEGNPLSFHPNHRNQTACYLHQNTTSAHFVLDNTALTKSEKRLAGSYYPHQSKSCSLTESVNLSADKTKRVRHVVIEEENVHRENNIRAISASPQRHLETKKQIEDLHKKFGESWLNSQSGLLDVLGLESLAMPLSSSPYEADFTIYSGDFGEERHAAAAEPVETKENINEEYNSGRVTPEIPDEADVEGEESIYLATVGSETEPIFIVIGQTHISEKESSTSDERVRWHINSIISCEVLDGGTSVQIDFETMRKDRKQRIYVFEEELGEFVACIKNKINSRQPKKGDDVRYQCMKCSVVFVRVKNESILGEAAVKCPSCDSTLVVEDV